MDKDDSDSEDRAIGNDFLLVETQSLHAMADDFI